MYCQIFETEDCKGGDSKGRNSRSICGNKKTRVNVEKNVEIKFSLKKMREKKRQMLIQGQPMSQVGQRQADHKLRQKNLLILCFKFKAQNCSSKITDVFIQGHNCYAVKEVFALVRFVASRFTQNCGDGSSDCTQIGRLCFMN